MDTSVSPPHETGSVAPSLRLTVLGTADLHGYVHNWDYFRDAEYHDSAGNSVGLAKIAHVIRQLRDARGQNATLTIDAGDTIQGTPLAYVHSRGVGTANPIAAVMNAIGYDAAAIGNHEFNYGLGALESFRSQLRHPLLAANADDWVTGRPAYDEFVLRRVGVGSEQVTVGIVGLVTPGCAIWDRAYLDGKVRFTGIVERAADVIPRVRQAGAQVVIVACHSGLDTSSSYGDALPWPENASALLAEQVPGIDAILVGHAHLEIAERFVVNAQTGREVLLTEPGKWGQRLSVMELELGPDNVDNSGGWQVVSASARLLDPRKAPEEPDILELTAQARQRTRAYTSSVIGTATAPMSAATARFEHSAALGFINHVQAATVQAALAGGPWAALPVLASTSPFNSQAAIPAGEVTVRDVAGLYPFDNSLLGLRLTGAQLREYLEFAARYFRKLPPDAAGHPVRRNDLTNAPTEFAPYGTPDYNYDVVSGLDEPLDYRIDVALEVGERIVELRYGERPVSESDVYVMAVNNYRASGGGNYPGVRQAEVLYDGGLEVRQLIIDWVAEHGIIDSASFAQPSWSLAVGAEPIAVTDGS